MKVLLSIKPEYANKLFSGEKKYEYRKAIFREEVDTIVVYATKPEGLILGELVIEDIIVDDLDALWERTQDASGISENFFRKYFSGCNRGYAIKVAEARRYPNPIDPYRELDTFIPPQSFRYMEI